MAWITVAIAAAKAVKMAYAQYNKYQKARAEDAAIAEILSEIRSVRAAVMQVQHAVIDEIRRDTLGEFEGKFRGLQTRLGNYDIFDRQTEYDQWVSEGERLREIVDDGADLIGYLEATINQMLDSDVDYAAKVFVLYASVLPLRAVAMVERTRNYSIDDEKDIPPMLGAAQELADRLCVALEARCLRQFSRDIIEMPGEPMNGSRMTQIGYDHGGSFHQVMVWYPGAAITLSNARDTARAMLSEAKEKAIVEYPGMELAKHISSHILEAVPM